MLKIKHPFLFSILNQLLFTILRRVVDFQSISLTKRVFNISYDTHLRIFINLQRYSHHCLIRFFHT